MSRITNTARVCETCGSPIDTTSAGDLGCIACLIGTGLDAEEGRVIRHLLQRRISWVLTRLSIMPMAAHGSSVTARWESLIARLINRSIVLSR